MKLKDALMLFLFGVERVNPSFNFRELKVLKKIPRSGRTPITVKGLEETGIARRSLFIILEKLIDVGVVEKRGHGYTGASGHLKSLNPITRYEGVFFALGMAYIIVGFGLANTPLGVAGILSILSARIIRFL
ncbi:hypothetical protein ES703_121524 [subsurface metagenome]